MKTILAVWHSGGKGKSGTLRELAKLLTAFPHVLIFASSSTIPTTGDFRLIIKIKGKVIGIESQGDPNTGLKNRLVELSDTYKCDVIFCSCRTRGETVNAVNFISTNRGFQTIWTSTYQIENKAQHNLVNQLKAKHILDLVTSLKIL